MIWRRNQSAPPPSDLSNSNRLILLATTPGVHLPSTRGMTHARRRRPPGNTRVLFPLPTNHPSTSSKHRFQHFSQTQRRHCSTVATFTAPACSSGDAIAAQWRHSQTPARSFGDAIAAGWRHSQTPARSSGDSIAAGWRNTSPKFRRRHCSTVATFTNTSPQFWRRHCSTVETFTTPARRSDDAIAARWRPQQHQPAAPAMPLQHGADLHKHHHNTDGASLAVRRPATRQQPATPTAARSSLQVAAMRACRRPSALQHPSRRFQHLFLVACSGESLSPCITDRP